MAARKLDNPLLESLGVHLVRWEVGICEFELDIDARHLNRSGSLQGGVTATMLDAACGYAGLITEADGRPGSGLTLMLTTSYLSRASTGRIRASGHVTRSGRSVYFASGDLRDGQGGLIATAQGTFKRTADSLARSLG